MGHPAGDIRGAQAGSGVLFVWPGGDLWVLEYIIPMAIFWSATFSDLRPYHIVVCALYTLGQVYGGRGCQAKSVF